MRILLVGDIVGAPGRAWFTEVARRLTTEGKIHAIIANAENAAGGSGLTAALANELCAAGATLLTLGDHTWGQRGFDTEIGGLRRVVRPANFPEGTPGAVAAVAETALGPIAVVSVVGQVFMAPADNPFHAVTRALREVPANVPVFVDVHAEAMSEKIAMGHWLDGRVACVFGTHTHVQTSDAAILIESSLIPASVAPAFIVFARLPTSMATSQYFAIFLPRFLFASFSSPPSSTIPGVTITFFPGK